MTNVQNLQFQSPELSGVDLVIPTYNPAEGWEQNLCARLLELKASMTGTSLHIIIVDDGSEKNFDDSSHDFIEKVLGPITLLRLDENRGKGYAVRRGLQLAKQSISAFIDVDMPYENRNIVDMIDLVAHNRADIAIGHRAKSYYVKIPRIRRMLSIGLKSMVRFFLRIPVSDTQSGLKVFNEQGRKAMLSTRVDRYLFDLEFIKLAYKRGLSIQSVELNERADYRSQYLSMRILWTEMGNFIRILLQ